MAEVVPPNLFADLVDKFARKKRTALLLTLRKYRGVGEAVRFAKMYGDAQMTVAACTSFEQVVKTNPRVTYGDCLHFTDHDADGAFLLTVPKFFDGMFQIEDLDSFGRHDVSSNRMQVLMFAFADACRTGDHMRFFKSDSPFLRMQVPLQTVFGCVAKYHRWEVLPLLRSFVNRDGSWRSVFRLAVLAKPYAKEIVAYYLDPKSLTFFDDEWSKALSLTGGGDGDERPPKRGHDGDAAASSAKRSNAPEWVATWPKNSSTLYMAPMMVGQAVTQTQDSSWAHYVSESYDTEGVNISNLTMGALLVPELKASATAATAAAAAVADTAAEADKPKSVRLFPNVMAMYRRALIDGDLRALLTKLEDPTFMVYQVPSTKPPSTLAAAIEAGRIDVVRLARLTDLAKHTAMKKCPGSPLARWVASQIQVMNFKTMAIVRDNRTEMPDWCPMDRYVDHALNACLKSGRFDDVAKLVPYASMKHAIDPNPLVRAGQWELLKRLAFYEAPFEHLKVTEIDQSQKELLASCGIVTKGFEFPCKFTVEPIGTQPYAKYVGTPGPRRGFAPSINVGRWIPVWKCFVASHCTSVINAFVAKGGIIPPFEVSKETDWVVGRFFSDAIRNIGMSMAKIAANMGDGNWVRAYDIFRWTKLTDAHDWSVVNRYPSEIRESIRKSSVDHAKLAREIIHAMHLADPMNALLREMNDVLDDRFAMSGSGEVPEVASAVAPPQAPEPWDLAPAPVNDDDNDPLLGLPAPAAQPGLVLPDDDPLMHHPLFHQTLSSQAQAPAIPDVSTLASVHAQILTIPDVSALPSLSQVLSTLAQAQVQTIVNTNIVDTNNDDDADSLMLGDDESVASAGTGTSTLPPGSDTEDDDIYV